MDSPDSPLSSRVLRFAQNLGTRSAQLATTPEALQRIEQSMASGAQLEDAALREVFSIAQRDRDVAGEFLNYFEKLVLNQAHRQLSPELRPLHDSTDLAQSVMAGLVSRLPHLYFNNRAQFLRLLSLLVRNKLAAYWREHQGEQAGQVVRLDDEQTPGSERTPISLARSLEEREALRKEAAKQPEPLRTILELYLAGADYKEIGHLLDMSAGAVRQHIRRFTKKWKEQRGED